MADVTKADWVRIVLSGLVWLATLLMAAFGLYLAYLHLALPNDGRTSSTIKLGENVEITSDIVGILVLFLALAFFIKAGNWFHSCFQKDPRNISDRALMEYLVKSPSNKVSKSDLLAFLTKER